MHPRPPACTFSLTPSDPHLPSGHLVLYIAHLQGGDHFPRVSQFPLVRRCLPPTRRRSHAGCQRHRDPSVTRLVHATSRQHHSNPVHHIHPQLPPTAPRGRLGGLARPPVPLSLPHGHPGPLGRPQQRKKVPCPVSCKSFTTLFRSLLRLSLTSPCSPPVSIGLM